jgi:hypothetical protein
MLHMQQPNQLFHFLTVMQIFVMQIQLRYEDPILPHLSHRRNVIFAGRLRSIQLGFTLLDIYNQFN